MRAGVSAGRSREALPADDELVDRLRRGDERAFERVVDEWSGVMLRIARSQLSDRGPAEDVVQDAWLTFLRDLGRFEGRSSLRTWAIGIVVNLARARSRSERRAVPTDELPAAVAPERFVATGAPRWGGHWAEGPTPWPVPEQELLAGETRDVILAATAELPAGQRAVITLRDIEGLGPAEVCDILGISDTNQRVLLHRARTRVRAALERYFGATEPT